jgi:RluA family pseudouridine synthase
VTGTLPLLARLHEDRDLVAVAKPPGEPVIAARGEPAAACLQKRLERELGRRLWVVHRIDRDASGVVVFARNPDAHRELSLAFEHRRVRKTYDALVAGAVEPWRGRVDTPLHGARKGKARPARRDEPGAQPATTEYTTVSRWALGAAVVSHLEAHPVTGRHHQIRVHLRSLGAPILFDPLYGRGLMPEVLAEAPCSRLALHARRIELPAPRGSGQVVVEAPLPPDLVALVEWLDSRGQKVALAGPGA